MAQLSIRCLGPFQVALGDQPITDFKSIKVRALLAYLAVEPNRPHPREVLAGLLWPDWPDRSALSNLRYALSDLRRAIGDRTANPPFLFINRETLQFNTTSDYWLDVKTFIDETEPARKKQAGAKDLHCIEESLKRYRGSFLEGFSVSDSPPFEEWTQLKRQQIDQQFSDALRFLTAAYEQQGKYEQSLAWTRRLLEIEPWDESAHQQLMRNLTLSGKRSEALAQYENCRQILSEELDVEPGLETRRLFEQIRNGQLKAPRLVAPGPMDRSVKLPQFLEQQPHHAETTLFVARGRELDQLDRFLNLSLAGRGRVAFVTGEAGGGKTALIQEFCRQSIEVHDALVVAYGNCNAYTGIGDPYLPFREILEMLAGDIEARWEAGAVTSEHARRLWLLMPVTAQAILEVGRGLLGTFIQPSALFERLLESGQESGRLERLAQLREQDEGKSIAIPSKTPLQQSDLFEQATSVFQLLSQEKPLLLVLDDLQWADLGSISLLFHLGRRLESNRILILGAYRSEEIALGRDGERHPLEPLVNEFQRGFGDILVNLGRADRQEFVDAVLDSEPNQLSQVFRDKLYRQTRGHPLFTVELLRGLQERGDLAQTSDGTWIEGSSLDWETLPARVEAAIAERIGRLAQPLQSMLRVACVEGEVFTAEVVARVQAADKRQIVASLSGELDRKHRLIRAQAFQRLGSERVSRYRFRNYLFQKYLYDNLDEVEKAYTHEDVGNALKELYGDQEAELAVSLAWHFQEAGIAEKAVYYLYLAGQKAVQFCAYRAGLDHLEKSLALLKNLPPTPEVLQQELELQISLGIAWQGFKGVRSYRVTDAYERARQICYQAGNTAQLCQVIGGMVEFYYVGAEYQKAKELAGEALRLAQGVDSILHLMFGHWYLGFVSFTIGEFEAAHRHLEQVIANYRPQTHHLDLVTLRGKDPGVGALAYDSCCLWCLGYPDQALTRSQEALALAREFDHPFTQADVLCFAGCLFNEMQENGSRLQEAAQEMMRLSLEKVPGWEDLGTSYYGEALTMLGRVEEGLKKIDEGYLIKQSLSARLYNSGPLTTVARTLAKSGRFEEASQKVGETIAFIDETNERYWEAEVYRNWGDVVLMQGQEVEAETKYRKAIDIARNQSARMLELRATMGLARLWQKQGKKNEARQMLEEIYNWFTEGFDTPDLIEAKAQLDDLL